MARRGDVLDCEEPPRTGRAPAVVLKELREYLMLSWLYCGCCNGVYVFVLCWGGTPSSPLPFDCEAREVGKELCVLRMGILLHMCIRPTMLFCTGGSSSVYTAVYIAGARSCGVV